MSDALIKQRLVLDGWAEVDIEPIFAARQAARSEGASMPPNATTAPVAPRSRRTRVLVVIIACLSVAVGMSVSGFFLVRPPVVYSISIPASTGATSTAATLSYGALPALSNPDYYGSVKENLLRQRTSFIDANLSDMQLTVYLEGVARRTVPILAKGKVGSWWETPVGIYQIQTKERNHLSSFGDVYMPYSMDFQGNFFVHGWPYYADGTPVSSTYSGGCIRLSTEDAGSVFDLVAVGMPIIVYNVAVSPDVFTYRLKAPPISAQEYLVADLQNGTVLLSKNASIAAPIASVSKLVTALVASEYINLDKTVTVPEEALVYTSIPRLKAGADVRAYDLLFLLLQESSNEAAETLAASIGRSRFVQYMNDKAHAIGLTHTVFSDPSGAKGDYSTTEDLFALLRYVHSNRRFVFGITSGSITRSAYGPITFSNVQNFNRITYAPAVLVGGKIGQTTEASQTYAGVFTLSVGGVERDIVVITLGSHDAEADVAKLLQFVHEQYASGDPASPRVLSQ